MTDQERVILEERLDQLEPLVEEYNFLRDLDYLIAEGFVELEDGRLYPIGDC